MVEVSGYELHERIGSGGIGDVFRAIQTSTGAAVAIKLVRRVDDDESMWRAIERELRALVELVGHANVVGVVEMVPTSAGRALVMEFAAGGSLAHRVARTGPLSVEEIVLVGRQVASALSAAHERGIVHRDVKPQNVLIDGYGQAKVCDFGVASLLRSVEFRDHTSALSMRYASPEDVEDEGHLVGPPSDVYSLGATLLFLRRGSPPTTFERVTGYVPPVDTTNPDAAELDRIIAELLTVNPYARPTMRAVYERLNEFDRRLAEPADSLLDDDAELFPTTAANPELLFPAPVSGEARTAPRGTADDGSPFPVPTPPVSPRNQEPGKRSISTPAFVPRSEATPAVQRTHDIGPSEDPDGPSEAALTAAFGPVADAAGAEPIRSEEARAEEMHRFWEDDTIYRVRPGQNDDAGTDDDDDTEKKRRRWPVLLMFALLIGGAVGVAWLMFGPSSDDQKVADPSTSTTDASSPSSSSAPSTSLSPTTTSATTTPPTTVPPTTLPPTTVPASTVPPTTEPPVTAPPSVAPRPPELGDLGSLDLTAIQRPVVAPGACLVQVAAELVATDCGEPHDLQLIAAPTASDGGEIAASSDSIREVGRLLCANQFIQLVHNDSASAALESQLKVMATAPTAQEWANGDRLIECWVWLPGHRMIGNAIGSGW